MRAVRFAIIFVTLLVLAGSATAQRANGPVPPPSDDRATDTILNGGFEAGGTSWSSFSNNGYNPFCTAACAGLPPHTGAGFVWLGGDGSPPQTEFTSISQSLTVSANSIATLTFYLYRPTSADSSTDDFYVTYAGYEIFRTTSSNVAVGSGYTQVSVSLTPYLVDGGLNGTLTFNGEDLADPKTSWLIDDIVLQVLPTSGNLIAQYGFEPPAGRAVLTSFWTLTAATTADKVKCDKPELGKIFSYRGDCAFMFKGGPGESTMLLQNIPASELTFATPISTDRWQLVYWRTANATGTIIAKAKFKYLEACGARAARDQTAGAGAASTRLSGPLYYGYSTLPAQFPCFQQLKKIKVSFKHKAISGKTFLDNTGFFAFQPVARGAEGALPPPAAPDGFRGGN